MSVDPEAPAAPSLAPAVLAAVSVGGVLGSLARYGLATAFPTATGTFPATTLTINLTGAFALAVLVGVITRTSAHPLTRPLLGTGVLGGYTTFSTFAVEADRLVSTGRTGTAVGYVAVSLLGGLAATAAGTIATARR